MRWSLSMTQDDQSHSGEDPVELFKRIGTKLSRRSFMAKSATVGGGALALSAGGSGTVAAGGDDEDGGSGDGGGGGAKTANPITDLEILNYALTLEKLEYQFYKQGLGTFDTEAIDQSAVAERTGESGESIRDRLTSIREHEQKHVNLLSTVIELLGGTPVSGLEFEFPYDSFSEFIALAATFEPLGVAAYAGAAPQINTELFIPTALSIHSVEANHAAYLRDLNGGSPVPVAFNDPATMASVTARVSQFIVGLKDDRQHFMVHIENVSSSDTLDTKKGSQPVPLSPGAYTVHSGENPIFTPGEKADQALERLAEDGFPIKLVEAMETSLLVELLGADNTVETGTFQSMSDGLLPIGPDESTTFYVTAAEGEALSFATMFVPSNDLFFAPCKSGIQLFQDGEPISGAVTDQIKLWDAGTEENQPPGVGEDIKPNQPLTAIEQGPEADNYPVTPIEEVDDEFEYPDISEVINVTVKPL